VGLWWVFSLLIRELFFTDFLIARGSLILFRGVVFFLRCFFALSALSLEAFG
jgi:hypothetical protein